mmetsp:Transcript_48505/g.128261  ORF Transcript_48505/g.128261 Transcript_48505/m.128261 type:complete len:375 (+) Transcript_48505:646-1770(+)
MLTRCHTPWADTVRAHVRGVILQPGNERLACLRIAPIQGKYPALLDGCVQAHHRLQHLQPRHLSVFLRVNLSARNRLNNSSHPGSFARHHVDPLVHVVLRRVRQKEHSPVRCHVVDGLKMVKHSAMRLQEHRSLLLTHLFRFARRNRATSSPTQTEQFSNSKPVPVHVPTAPASSQPVEPCTRPRYAAPVFPLHPATPVSKEVRYSQCSRHRFKARPRHKQSFNPCVTDQTHLPKSTAVNSRSSVPLVLRSHNGLLTNKAPRKAAVKSLNWAKPPCPTPNPHEPDFPGAQEHHPRGRGALMPEDITGHVQLNSAGVCKLHQEIRPHMAQLREEGERGQDVPQEFLKEPTTQRSGQRTGLDVRDYLCNPCLPHKR